MKYLKPIALGVFAMTLFSSCTWQNKEELFVDDSCDTELVNYAQDVQPVLSQNCYSCHSTTNAPVASGLDLEDAENLQNVALNGRLLGSLNHESGYVPMPPSGIMLDSCAIEKIKKWIDEGAEIN